MNLNPGRFYTTKSYELVEGGTNFQYRMTVCENGNLPALVNQTCHLANMTMSALPVSPNNIPGLSQMLSWGGNSMYKDVSTYWNYGLILRLQIILLLRC